MQPKCPKIHLFYQFHIQVTVETFHKVQKKTFWKESRRKYYRKNRYKKDFAKLLFKDCIWYFRTSGARFSANGLTLVCFGRITHQKTFKESEKSCGTPRSLASFEVIDAEPISSKDPVSRKQSSIVTPKWVSFILQIHVPDLL